MFANAEFSGANSVTKVEESLNVFAVPEALYCTESCAILVGVLPSEELLLESIAGDLFPTICFRVPEGDTVGGLGAASGERPVLWRLAIVAGALRLLQCCELWNCVYEAFLTSSDLF